MKEDKEKKGGRGIEERERNERIKGKKKKGMKCGFLEHGKARKQE